MVIYIVVENSAMVNGSIGLKAFKSKERAEKFAVSKAKRQKNKPQYDDWGLCEGIEYLVRKMRVY